MIFGITGTKKGMTYQQKVMVRSAFKVWKIYELHHGDCIGADAEAGDIARLISSCNEIIIHPPDNPKYRAFCSGDIILPEKPYSERDKDIVHACQYLIATPRGMHEELRSGTWATVRYAKKYGRRITIFYPDGSLEHINNNSILF